MVAHTKKSRNIRHKTLKHRTVDETKIVGGIPDFFAAEKAKKELPTFDSFFNLEKKEGEDRPLYEIQYVTNPSYKYSVWKTGITLSERKNFLSLGNAYFFCKGSSITTDFSNGLIPIDFSSISIDTIYNNLKYIVFELIDHIKFDEKKNEGYPIIPKGENNLEARKHIFSVDGRYFAIIFYSEDCPPTMSQESIDENPECKKDDKSYLFFSHFIIKEVSKTLADIKGRFARGNRSNTLIQATKRLFGADSYRMIFKNETFLDFLSEDFFKKKGHQGFRSCKDKSSALCSDLNEINSNFTRTTELLKNNKFISADFIDVNYLRLLFILKYQYTKAIDYGRLNMLCDIFALFKQEILAKDENEEFAKKISESIVLQFFHFFSNNGGFIKFILETLSKFINGGLRNGFFRDVRLSKKEIEAISQLEKEESLKETGDESLKETGDESAIAVAVASTVSSTIKGGHIGDILPNISKKITGDATSKSFNENIKNPKNRFLNVEKIDTVRLARLGTFSLRTDRNYFLKLLNKYINMNEFDDENIYENDIQNILIGGLISFFIEMFKKNTEKEKRKKYIENLTEILKKYYPKDPKDPNYLEYFINQLQNLSKKAPDPPTTPDSEVVIAVAVAASSSVLKGGNPDSTDANIELSSPEVNSIEYITTNATYYSDKKKVIESFKTIVTTYYKKNTNKKQSLCMAYDFHDIVEYFGYRNSKDAKGDQNRPLIYILSYKEILDIIDKSFYFQYILMVKQWIIELKKKQPMKKIVDFMTKIIECIILGSHLICSSGWGIVGIIAMIPPIPLGAALGAYSNILDPRCLQSGALLIRTVMSEWMDREALLQFSKNANQTIQQMKEQRDKIEAAKKEEKEKVVVKSISSKEPMCYVQFGTDFEITYIYVQHIDGENNIFYIKHNSTGSPITDVKPIPKADIIKYLVSSDTANFTFTSQPQAKLIASTIIGQSNILNLLKTNKGPLTGSMYGPIITNPNITPIEGVCLENIGNSCFINVVIQFLFSIESIRRFLNSFDFNIIDETFLTELSKKYNEYFNKENTQVTNTSNKIYPNKNIFYQPTEKISLKLSSGKDSGDISRISWLQPIIRELINPIHPEKIQNNGSNKYLTLSEKGFNLVKLLKESTLTDDGKTIDAINNQSDASDILMQILNTIKFFLYDFIFFSCQILHCKDSKNDNTENNIVFNYILTLDIHNNSTNIQNIINKQQETELISDKSDSCGEKGGELRDKKTSYHILDSTTCLIIYLKRFKMIVNSDGTFTNTKIKTDIDIKQFTLDNVIFKIKTAILHGGTTTGGHYVFAEYDLNGNISRVFDDSKITTANEQKTRTPYILLYERQT